MNPGRPNVHILKDAGCCGQKEVVRVGGAKPRSASKPAGRPRPAAGDTPKLTECQKLVGALNGRALSDATAGRPPQAGRRGLNPTAPKPAVPAPAVKVPVKNKPVPNPVGAAAAAPTKRSSAPMLSGTGVRGTASGGQKLQEPSRPGRVTVSSEKGFGRVGAKMGAKGRAAAVEAAERRMQGQQ